MENNTENNKNIKNNHSSLYITLFSIADILSVVLTPVLMYAIYVIQYQNNPEVSILSGYWIGFIFIIVPISGILYSYTRKIKDGTFKYLILLFISVICLIALIILLAVGITNKL